MEKLIIWGDQCIWKKASIAAERFLSNTDIEILGICLRDPVSIHTAEKTDYPRILPNDPEWGEASCVLVCTEYFTPADIAQVLRDGAKREQLVPYDLLLMQGFSFSRYMKLLHSRPTIISNSCWGGLTYHYFHLPFLSPTINLFFFDDEYLRFLEDFDQMIRINPKFSGMEFNPAEDLTYPVFSIENVSLHMNHCHDRDQGLNDWIKRRERINRENMLIMFSTRSERLAERFEKLSFRKKICFVPFKTDLPSCVTVNNGNTDTDFHLYINSFATGARVMYDPWILLEEGKIKIITNTDEQSSEKTQEELAAKINKARYILIYGAWSVGKQACERILKYLPERMYGFAVTDLSGNNPEKMGFPVRSIQEWHDILIEKQIPFDQVLSVMALHPMYYRQVRETLENAGIFNILSFEEEVWYFNNQQSAHYEE